jgi:superfamily II DNA or RNA helicase
MATFDQFISSLRKEFGEQDAGKKFEVFCKWFLENDPEWSKSVDKVWLWDEYPEKWQREDLGCDLVFRDKDGLIWAVQSKCFSEHRPTKKDDMNSFLADSGRKVVDRRLWMQTTDKIEAKAKKTCKGQDKPVTFYNLRNFRDAQIDFPASFSELYQAKVKDKPTPEPHQKEAIQDVISALTTVDRGQLIMACGTGKTFTTLWIKEGLQAHSTLVLMPSLNLLSQTMRDWAWASNTDFEILNVCSDKSVGKKSEDMKPEDAPFRVTSEVEEIIKFLKNPKPKVIFCTYKSSPLIAEAHNKSTLESFDLTIADEAHRCAGKAEAGFATVLDGNKIRSSKRLFTTATPRYFGKAIKDAAKAKDLAIVGMDNEEVFGSVLHKLTFGKAIQDGHLTDYQMVIIGVNEPMVKQYIDQQEIVAINSNETTDARTLAAKIGLLKAIKDYDLKRVISFHSLIEGARKFSEELIDVVNLIDPLHKPEGTFLSNYVSGNMNAGERKDKIDRLKILKNHDRGILTNARCLAEGVDVPSLDGVAFIDPKGSQVEIIQAVGRAIRKVRGAEVQTKGTIVIPVFIEDGDDPETSIENSNFKPVWDVLKALRAHDEALSDELDQYRTNMAKNVTQLNRNISDKVIFDIPSTIDVEFSNALQVIMVEAATASWEFWYGLLQVFNEKNGHCKVNALHIENGYKLGFWVSNQRKQKNNLTHQRIRKLDELGFDWDVLRSKWNDGYLALKKFIKREGHLFVHANHIEGGFPLGNWVARQRALPERCSIEQVKRLNSLNFIWDTSEYKWETGFNYLQIYKMREGHANPAGSHIEDTYKLGSWLSKQRERHKKKTLLKSQKKRLISLGVVLLPSKDTWEVGFKHLQNYKNREGNCIVPSPYKEKGYALGRWVAHQREKKDNLSFEQIRRLNSLDFVWSVREYFWETGFKHLQSYMEREGNSFVPDSHLENGFNLTSWVKRQRRRYKDDKMPEEEKQRLIELGFSFDPQKDKWGKNFIKLKKFYEREGHTNVKREHVEDGFSLGQWVSKLRKTKTSLSIDQKNKLTEIGFAFDI